MLKATAPSTPAGPAPARAPGSIRRTSSLDSAWPQGRGTPMHIRGRARDLFTAPDLTARVMAEDTVDIVATPQREIVSILASRLNGPAQELVGRKGGGRFRAEIARLFPDEVAGATPLHLLLDDFPGMSLVAGWAWTRWTPTWREDMIRDRTERMEGVCSGFRTGSQALFPDGRHDPTTQISTPVPGLADPEDPLGWHELHESRDVSLRRARRCDVWFEDGLIHARLGFQDSATLPAGGRIGQHEYEVHASVEVATMRLAAIRVDPRVLPYPECPLASPNAARLVGAPVAEFRQAVLAALPGPDGCTHLNDVLRTMADIPALARSLQAALAAAVSP